MAQTLQLVVLPVITKIDREQARVDEVSLEIADLLACPLEHIQLVSGKTGAGVGALLDHIVSVIPEPASLGGDSRALVFDFSYTKHTGINAFARVFNGSFSAGDRLRLQAVRTPFPLKGVGVFLRT